MYNVHCTIRNTYLPLKHALSIYVYCLSYTSILFCLFDELFIDIYVGMLYFPNTSVSETTNNEHRLVTYTKKKNSDFSMYFKIDIYSKIIKHPKRSRRKATLERAAYY